jgi:hypothetical protein
MRADERVLPEWRVMLRPPLCEGWHPSPVPALAQRWSELGSAPPDAAQRAWGNSRAGPYERKLYSSVYTEPEPEANSLYYHMYYYKYKLFTTKKVLGFFGKKPYADILPP